jgi:hypothetical protein
MKLSELYRILTQAMLQSPPETEVLLHYEQSAMEDGFSETTSEGISDIRLMNDWPLPGDSMVNNEGTRPKKLVIFYDNHFNLDSSIEP